MRRLYFFICLILFAVSAQAITLSADIQQINKRMFQPVKAYIAINDIDPALYLTDIKVQLATEAIFSKLQLERQFFITKLDFSVVKKNHQWLIEISSYDLVKEPYISFIVELTTPNKQLYREYTLLFDAPANQPTSDAIPLPNYK